MLHITGSMRILKQEVFSAKNVIKDILDVLDSVRPESNLTESVGIFVVQMPDYKVLGKDADSAKQILRKVCSGEIDIPDAIILFSSSYDELSKLSNMLNNFN